MKSRSDRSLEVVRVEDREFVLADIHLALAQIGGDAGHGARADGADGGLHISMDVATIDAADMTMAGKQCPECLDSRPILVLERVGYDADLERRVVHEHERRP